MSCFIFIHGTESVLVTQFIHSLLLMLRSRAKTRVLPLLLGRIGLLVYFERIKRLPPLLPTHPRRRQRKTSASAVT